MISIVSASPSTARFRSGRTRSATRTGPSAFGAAFNFRAPDWSMVQTYFASNEGWGIFELVYPLEVPEECWNSGEEGHSVCEEGAQLLWRMPSEKSKSNDGMNCPLGAGAPPEAQPSPQPVELMYAPTPQPQEETDDEPQYEAGVFDCDHHGNPVQVLREDDDEPYRVVELDASSGRVQLLYEMDYLDIDTRQRRGDAQRRPAATLL